MNRRKDAFACDLDDPVEFQGRRKSNPGKRVFPGAAAGENRKDTDTPSTPLLRLDGNLLSFPFGS